MLINRVTECTNFIFNVFLNKSKAITNNISFTHFLLVQQRWDIMV